MEFKTYWIVNKDFLKVNNCWTAKIHTHTLVVKQIRNLTCLQTHCLISVLVVYSQVLFFPGEWITYVLLVLVGLLDLRSQWCRQSLDKLAQCPHAFISFTDFIFLKMYRKDTIGWNTPLRSSQSCWILFNGRGRSVYRFGRHLELHELCFSTENLPGCMDLQKAHISNFSLKQHTQQKQRGPLHFCSCTIAPMACAVQQLKTKPKNIWDIRFICIWWPL